MPTSSTVWCASTCRSPVACTVRSKPACRPELLHHVVEEGQAGRHLGPTRAVEHQLGLDRRLLGGACLRGAAGIGGHRLSFRAWRKRSFSSAVPMVTRRQPRRPSQLAQLRIRTEWSSSALPHLVGVAVPGPEQNEIGVGGPAVHRQVAQRGRHPPPLLGDARHPGLHLGHVAQRDQAGDLRLGRQVIGQHHRLARRHDGRIGHQVAEARPGHGPRLGEGAGHHEAGLRPGRAAPGPTTARTARRPRRRSRGRARPRCTAATVSGGSARPVGLLGEHRNVTSGRCAASSSQRVRGVDQEVVVAGALDHLGPGDPRDVAVQRVRGLEHQGATARPAEGQEQALQHLVRTVGTEHLVRRDPVQVGHGLASSVAGRSG